MSIEQNLKNTIEEELSKGIIEEILKEKLKTCISDSIDSLFTYNGSVKKAIEKKLKETMIPVLENYNYNQFIPKLDLILTQIVNDINVNNRSKKMLKNFSKFLTTEKIEEIKVTQIFDKYKEYVADNVECSYLEIDCDYEATYQNVNIEMDIIELDKASSFFNYFKLNFTCEEDEKLNQSLTLMKHLASSTYTIRLNDSIELSSLRYYTEFEMFLLNLAQMETRIIIDEKYMSDKVEPNELPD